MFLDPCRNGNAPARCGCDLACLKDARLCASLEFRQARLGNADFRGEILLFTAPAGSSQIFDQLFHALIMRQDYFFRKRILRLTDIFFRRNVQSHPATRRHHTEDTMSIHPLFAAPTRPAPILFPLDSRDKLLWERKTALEIGYHGIDNTKQPFSICSKQFRWSARIDARIAQVVS